MKLKIGNEIINISESFELYNKIRSEFAVDAMTSAKRFVDLYDKYGNLDNTLQKFIEFISSKLEERIEKSCALLFQLGVYDVSSVEFAEKYYKYISIDDSMSQITDKLEEICERENELELYSEIKKLGRTQWSSGGFGLSGAISGAIASTALNAAYGVFYAIGDALRQRSNQNKINRLKMELYNDQETSTIMFWCIHNACMGVFYGLRDELEDYNIFEPLEFNSEKASILNENALKYSENEDQKIELLIKSICIDPYNFLLYEPIFSEFPNTEGLKEYASYFCIDKTYALYMEFERNQRLKAISKAPVENHNQLCFIVKLYIDISKEYNYDTTKEINALSERFLNFCNSIELIDETLSILTRQIDHEAIKGIITTLENRKTFFIEQERIKQQQAREKKQKDDLFSINNYEAYLLEEVIKKVELYMEHSLTYNCDVEQYIYKTLTILSDECSNQEKASKIIKELNKIKHEKFPCIDKFIHAFSTKKKMLKFEEQLDFSCFYIVSPVIIDLINKAREGNAIAQQWLVEFLLQQEALDKLKSNYFNGASIERQNAEKTITRISEVIAYLFDKPQIYSFDLFMRIKVSYPLYKNIDDYIKSLEPFSRDSMCSAGVFEYGRQLYEKKEYDSAIKTLKISSEFGYLRAVELLYKHYSNIDAKSCESLLFKTILPHSRWRRGIHNYNNYTIDNTYDSRIKLIHDMFTGQIFSFNSSEQFSVFLHNIFTEFSDKKHEYGLGYMGNFSEKAHLKTTRFSFGVSGDECPLLSYNCKNHIDSYTLLFTNKNLYFSKNQVVRRISYDDFFVPLNKSIFGEVMYNVHIFRQIYAIAYYSNNKYSADDSIDELEKMAFCGNPLAICNLLSNNKYILSDDKKDFWIQLKNKWEAQGKYYAVCPNCHEVRTKEDVFCPECGAKIY